MNFVSFFTDSLAHRKHRSALKQFVETLIETLFASYSDI